MSSKVASGLKAPVLPFALITTLFFMWGLANNMTDTLLAAFKKIMSMSDFQTSWIQLAFYGSYFMLALPAAIFIKKYTYKSGVLLGLTFYAIGCFLFYPASLTTNYFHFLAALYILAGGCSILETAANPYIIEMGPEESGTRRLNFAQSFNPIGSISGILLSKFFILSNLNVAGEAERSAMNPAELQAIQKAELNSVTMTYVGVGIILLVIWLIIAFTKMPRAKETDKKLDLGPTFKRLFGNKHYLWGVVAQFFYVGAQIGVWSYTIRYVMQELNINEDEAASYYLASLVLFMVARFINTFLMKYITPGNLLTGSAFLAIFCTLIVIFGGGMVAVIALVAISGFMSLMFPTIYGLAVRGLGEDTKIAASGLIMAILGGAVLTAIQGQISDLSGSIHMAYFVPLVCFALVAIYGKMDFKSKSVRV
ncbi:MAG: L-fucose:H+ symporter permease [Candidatus Cyclobacteriaceae bacterium M3_2C_046]